MLYIISTNTKSIDLIIAVVFPKTGLLLSFLLEADLLPSILLGAGSSDDPVVFSIEMNEAAILFGSGHFLTTSILSDFQDYFFEGYNIP